MFPHCFNMVWRWSPRVSSLFRDWLMLMLRRGVTTSDQEPLRLAESREALASGLRVGQMPAEFGAAMYSAHAADGPHARFWPRISRRLRGAVRLVHATPVGADGGRAGVDPSSGRVLGRNGRDFCTALNADVGVERQLVQFEHEGALFVARNDSHCRALLGNMSTCPYASGGMRQPASDGEVLPTKLIGVGEMTRKIAWEA